MTGAGPWGQPGRGEGVGPLGMREAAVPHHPPRVPVLHTGALGSLV